ncbi:hypothetical protein J25TS1_16360 [Bacillus paralicheniformis]|nr:hypothetical protein J25TS1_16360 [Bacillus paralicheniformis]
MNQFIPADMIQHFSHMRYRRSFPAEKDFPQLGKAADIDVGERIEQRCRNEHHADSFFLNHFGQLMCIQDRLFFDQDE